MTMCFACGQLFCGDCTRKFVPKIVQGSFSKCPACRAPLFISHENDVERLQKLLKRSPGRITPTAQFNLGVLLSAGLGKVAQDDYAAFKWLKLAADQGQASAQCYLGSSMCTQGRGAEKSDEQAAKWLQLAAEQGHREAQYHLGRCHLTCENSSIDSSLDEAVRLFHLAAEQEHEQAASLLQQITSNRDVWNNIHAMMAEGAFTLPLPAAASATSTDFKWPRAQLQEESS